MSAVAHLDEAGARLSEGRRLSVLAAVVTDPIRHDILADAVRAAQIPGRPWHFRDETSARRVKLAHVVADLELHGALVVTTSSGDTGQERARARILEYLWLRLLHGEHVERAVLETRGGSDKHDHRTLTRMRRHKQLSSALRVDHEPKGSPLLQLADFVASAYVAAQQHNETEPWEIIADAHVIDVRELAPR